ncbi:uncharacterized protein LOC123407524 isoform X3 [Hordeum vulgare subsp. vulgare]|uniref:Uncharacterized protein n=1 Tax=Hordeum vulgare subsp. vulgare TaxID=112509 RepID=A0A8I6YDT3_HORVV|nr:uncharacterized protein LOC123407524 isoform X3 [Hordeum vulgare subsp. vulgare]
MTSAAAAAASIYSVSSYALSPHAAPFTPPSRPACAPLECRQNGDVSRLADASSVGYAEEKTSRDTYSALPIACALMKSSGAVYPPSTHAMHTGQPSSWSAVCPDAYPSSPYVRITSNYKQQSLTSGNVSKCSTVRIERPPNKTSETNKNSCGSGSKLVIAENSKSNKDSEKETSSRSLQFNGPVDGKENSQGTMISSNEANPVFSASPLHIPTTSADSCGVLAEDVMPDPSECSVDSPCYRGASASRLSPFDVFQTPATQSTNQELEAFAVRQKQSSSTVQHHETPSELQSLVTKTNRDHCKSQTEAVVSKKSGAISIKETKKTCGKELECANQYAAKCELEQKHLLGLRGDYMKRSGLNSAAPDFVPSLIGKSKIGKGPCPSTGKNISGVLKAIENLTVVFQSSFSGDEIELDEDDYILLESVIDSLQTCLHKIRKDPIKGASDKAGPKTPHSQTTVLKSDARKYNSSYIADGEKDIIINHFAGSSHIHNEFGRNGLTRGQPALNNVQKKMPCEEEHPQVLVYKNLWIEAERANCELKYQLKHTCIKIDIESSMAPIGGPRKNYSQVSDLSTDPSNLYGVALARPTGETSGARNSQYLPHAGDCTQSGGDATLSCSSSTKGYTALPKNLQHGHVLTGLEETATHRHAPLPYRACQGLSGGTLDGVTARSYLTGQDGILRSNPKYGSSDWEHVLTEEIGWS